jgi:CotS family spore coat protein
MLSEEITTNGYIIEPWDHLMMTQSPDGSVHDQYVPPELEDLARQVMERYDMSVSSMTLITAKPDKGGAIWRIETNHGPRSIKVLHRTPNRSLFSIGAQDYLVQQGARVPALIRTRQGNQYVVAGGKAWIVTEWVEPLTPVSKVALPEVQELCRGLGEFHRLSRGYVPPFGAVKASRLYRWPKFYEKIITKLQWFEEIATIYSEFPASGTLLSMLTQVKTEATNYYQMFRDSAYERMVGMGEPYWGLAHQDYGWSNGQMGPGGVWIIDLDGVAYDIPIRDLRKLITSTMVDNGGWDLTWVRGMIEAYNESNPIDRETYELLWIDMAFPNEFYKHVKEVVYQPEIFIPTELEPILNLIGTVEATKWPVLEELRSDMMSYPSGEYPEVQQVSIVTPLLLPETMPAVSWPVRPVAAAVGDITPIPEGEVAVGSTVPAAPFFPSQRGVIGSSRRNRRLRRGRRRTGRRRSVRSGNGSAARAGSRSRRMNGRTNRTRPAAASNNNPSPAASRVSSTARRSGGNGNVLLRTGLSNSRSGRATPLRRSTRSAARSTGRRRTGARRQTRRSAIRRA